MLSRRPVEPNDKELNRRIEYSEDNPTSIGTFLGLDSHRQLYKSCADFYLLEELFKETHPWDGDTRTKHPMSRLPLDFGWDSKRELIALSVRRTYSEKILTMAEEFAFYMSLACGGELRHAVGWIQNQKKGQNKVKWNCKHQHGVGGACCKINYIQPAQSYMDYKSPFAIHCKSGKCEHWSYAGYAHPDYRPCDCQCPHNHNKKCKQGLYGCQYTNVGSSIHQMCCAHMHTPDERIEQKQEKLEVPELIGKFFYECDAVDEEGTIVPYEIMMKPRGTGWGLWYRSALAEDPAAAMQQCADMFARNEVWGGQHTSIGGENWRVIAQLAADYYAGNIKQQTLIDRCWTLQHNGGSVFDKFYSTDWLMDTLEIQARNDYVSLSTKATDYIKDLWRQHQFSIGKMSILDVVSTAVKNSITPTTGFAEWMNQVTAPFGCLSCAWATYTNSSHKTSTLWKLKVNNHEIIDPCGHTEGVWTTHKSCYYTSQLKQAENNGFAFYLQHKLDEYDSDYLGEGNGCLYCCTEMDEYEEPEHCYNPEGYFANPECDYVPYDMKLVQWGWEGVTDATPKPKKSTKLTAPPKWTVTNGTTTNITT